MVSRRKATIKTSYVLCLNNTGDEASLERNKIYRRLPDRKAASLEMIRVIDESGEDYLFPRNWFAPISLPPALARHVQSNINIETSSESSSTTPSSRSR